MLWDGRRSQGWKRVGFEIGVVIRIGVVVDNDVVVDNNFSPPLFNCPDIVVVVVVIILNLDPCWRRRCERDGRGAIFIAVECTWPKMDKMVCLTIGVHPTRRVEIRKGDGDGVRAV